MVSWNIWLEHWRSLCEKQGNKDTCVLDKRSLVPKLFNNAFHTSEREVMLEVQEGTETCVPEEW